MITNFTHLQTKVITTFLIWYLVEVPRDIIRGTWLYVKTTAYVFSIVYLLRTFFAPWKGMRYMYPQKGFDIATISHVFASNMVSRTVGGMVRGGVILIGLLMMLGVVVSGLICLLFWLTFPVIGAFVMWMSLTVDVI
jgi:hypothetical protein